MTRFGKCLWAAALIAGGLGATDLSAQQGGDVFAMIVMGDPQYPWLDPESERRRQRDKLCGASAGSCSDFADHVQSTSTINNSGQVISINGLIAQSPVPVRGVVINGDLSAFGHQWQIDKFEELYEPLAVPSFLGLGNHDYLNNVGDSCNGVQNLCATNSIAFYLDYLEDLQNQLAGTRVAADLMNLPKSTLPSFVDADLEVKHLPPFLVFLNVNGSLAYSWDIGDVHFVQLNNFPTYETSFSSAGFLRAKYKVEVDHALDWLDADLERAKAQGKRIVLNFHDLKEHWGKAGLIPPLPSIDGVRKTLEAHEQAQWQRFSDMLRDYRVSAVFVGHLHSRLGDDSNKCDLDSSLGGADPKCLRRQALHSRNTSVTPRGDNIIDGTASRVNFRDVPTIFSGAPSYQSYLFVTFDTGQDIMTVEKKRWELITDFTGGRVSARIATLTIGHPIEYDLRPSNLP